MLSIGSYIVQEKAGLRFILYLNCFTSFPPNIILNVRISLYRSYDAPMTVMLKAYPLTLLYMWPPPPFWALSDWYPDTLIQTVWWSHDVVISICGDLYVTVFRYLKSIYSPARVRGFTFVYLDHIYTRRSMWFQQLERCKPTNSIWTVSIFRQSCNGLMALKNFLFSSVPNILCELGSSVKVKA